MQKKAMYIFLMILLLGFGTLGCEDSEVDEENQLQDEEEGNDQTAEEENDEDADEEEQDPVSEDFEGIETALQQEEWRAAGELIEALSKEDRDAVVEWEETLSDQENIDLRNDQLIGALMEGVMITENRAEIHMDTVMENRFQPLDKETLQGSEESLYQWFQEMENWRMDEVILFHNNFLNIAEEINPERSETVLITEAAQKAADPFMEYVDQWFYGRSEGNASDLWMGVDSLEIAGMEFASSRGAGFGPMHPAIELLAEENELIETKLEEDRLVLVIDNIQEGYSLSPGTFELIYEIEEVEDGKYGIRGYEVEEIKE